MPDKRNARMNDHERRAWRQLVAFGAREWTLGGKRALDLRAIRHGIGRSERDWSLLIGALYNVAGRSGVNRKHVDRLNNPVFIVTDERAACEATASFLDEKPGDE